MYDQELIDLEDALRRLKVDYDIFFNGHRKKPPDELRFRVEKLVKRLSESNLSFQERFRYNTLVGRFYVYRDLWRRNQNELELGADVPEEVSSGRPGPPGAPIPSPAGAISVSISNPDLEEAKVRELYDALLRLRDVNRLPTFSYEQFARYIAKQTRGIRGRYHCPAVNFTIAVQDDTIKFVAKAEIAP